MNEQPTMPASDERSRADFHEGNTGLSGPADMQPVGEGNLISLLQEQQKEPFISRPRLYQLAIDLSLGVLFFAYAFSPWPAWLGEEVLPRPNWPLLLMVFVWYALRYVLAKSFKKARGATAGDVESRDHSYNWDSYYDGDSRYDGGSCSDGDSGYDGDSCSAGDS